MKFFYDLICPPSRAVLIFAKLARIPIQEEIVALRKKEHLTEEFKLKVGRHQRLPILHDDDGYALAESVAIFRYLTTKLNIDGPLYPADFQQRARVDEYLAWTHNNIRAAVAFFIFGKWLKQVDNQETIRFLENRLDNVLDEMNNVWLGESRYLTGDAMTIADIFGVCDIEQIKVSGKDFFQGRDRLKDWYDRVVPRLQPHFQEIHTIVQKFAEKSANKVEMRLPERS